MLYLGTFGSLLQLPERVDSVIHQPVDVRSPYSWLLSVPGFGPTIEGIAGNLFPGLHDVEARLRMLDSSAAAGQAGADGYLFLLPVWDSIGAERGRYWLYNSRDAGSPTTNQLSRALLESLGYAVRARTTLDEVADPQVHVGGGGATSQQWLQVLADVLEKRLIVRSGAHGARGAAEIAALSVNANRVTAAFASDVRIVEPTSGFTEAIDRNVRLAREMYSATLLGGG